MPTELLNIFSQYNIILFIAVMTRVSAMFMSAPVFSTFPITPQVKIWLCASISFLIFPFILAQGGFVMPTTIPELFIILLKEFAIGYTIGFCANLVFIALDMAANLISIQMALSASQALDPLSGVATPVLGRAYTLLAALVFLSLHAHKWLLGAVFSSFSTAPVGYSFIFNGAFVQKVVYITGQMFHISLGIALPIFGVLLIKDVLLGFVSKLMPQMNVIMVAMPLKVYVGLLLSLIFLQSMCSHLRVVIENLLINVMQIF